jgi:monofunctional biosynthetic peptidoglycan transglycosylase
MARKTPKSEPAKTRARARPKVVAARAPLWRRVLRWARLGLLGALALFLLSVVAYRFFPPPTTLTILQLGWRTGGVERQWLPIEDMPVTLRRAALAAEDARFCLHWGFDMAAIRAALEDGGARGASTISQQVVKNVWLWQGRSWPRKALEALITPLMEALWPKRRILEVYLNVAEFDEGVFGVDAGAYRYFSKIPAELSLREAALLVAVLPDPDDRDAGDPSARLRARAAAIEDGARTLERDGRAACIED